MAGLTPVERAALQAKVNAARAKQMNPTSSKGKEIVGAPDPAQVRGGARKDWRYRNRTGGVVQGDEKRRPGAPPKRPTLAELEKAKQKAKRDKNPLPDKGKSNKSTATPQEPRPENDAQRRARERMNGPDQKGKGGVTEGELGGHWHKPKPPVNDPKLAGKYTKAFQASQSLPPSGKKVADMTEAEKDALRADMRRHDEEMVKANKKKPPEERDSTPREKGNAAYENDAQHRIRYPRGTKTNSQPGVGAPTGGTGKDADGGKQRTEFENQRRRQNQGGNDRPGIYKPPTDYRGGYKSKPIPPIPTKKKAPPKPLGVPGMTRMVT